MYRQKAKVKVKKKEKGEPAKTERERDKQFVRPFYAPSPPLYLPSYRLLDPHIPPNYGVREEIGCSRDMIRIYNLFLLEVNQTILS